MKYKTFKTVIFNITLFLLLPIKSMNEIQESKKLVSDLTKNNSKVLAQFDTFANTLLKANSSNKISNDNFKQIVKALNFAANKHSKQVRKDPAKTPYIIHPIGVADNILNIGKVYDVNIIIGGLLHDTVEDTQTTFEEINQNFGKVVENYVREVTDDKSLPKAERKRLQIVNASHKSHGASIIKLSDKLYNLTDMLNNPPPDWSKERVNDYFKWAQKVVNNLPSVNVSLKNEVDKVINEYLETTK